MEAFLQYLTFPFLLEGMWLTLRIFLASMAGGLALGLLIALMRLSPYRLLAGLAWTYVWLIRARPSCSSWCSCSTRCRSSAS